MEWQPIETAPKDGTEIWAYNGEQVRMHWITWEHEGESGGMWQYADEILSDVAPDCWQPTHWMPLPEPPV